MKDLCASKDIRDDVKKLYYEHQSDCNKYITPLCSSDSKGPRKYYVYAWYTKTTPKKYFYVGKGTGDRANHILADIEKATVSHSSMRRWRLYAMLQKSFGIDYKILANNLTNFESYIYEECYKLKLLNEGEFLLCYEGVPNKYLKSNTVTTEGSAIEWSGFYEKYYNINQKPYFDLPHDGDYSLSYFHKAGIPPEEYEQNTSRMIESISTYIKSNNGRVYSSVTAKTANVLVAGYLCEDLYIRYRQDNKKIYSLQDVYKYLINVGLIVEDRNVLETSVDYMIKNKIKNKLACYGVPEKDIHFGDQTVYAGGVYVRYHLYKKRPECRIEIQREIADMLKIPLANHTAWKSDYIFNIHDEHALDRINEYFFTLSSLYKIEQLKHKINESVLKYKKSL